MLKLNMRNDSVQFQKEIRKISRRRWRPSYYAELSHLTFLFCRGRARVTLAGGLTFSLLNTPARVNPPTRVNLSTCFQTL